MYIEKLIIKKNEKVVANLSFRKGLNAIANEDYILDVILCVLGKKVAMTLDGNYSFTAKVFVDDKYLISGCKKMGGYFWDVAVFGEKDQENCTEEYYNMLRTNAEMDGLFYFNRFEKLGYTNRLEHYKDILQYYPEGEFTRVTDGYGTTRSFRGFITQYINNFKPIKLRSNKGLFLNLLKSGRFVVTDSENREVKNLSEAEKLLYHYFSFLSLGDFWTRAEKIRNLNMVNKPLIVTGFLEFLDNGINLTEIFHYTDKVGRQVIMLIPKEALASNYNIQK